MTQGEKETMTERGTSPTSWDGRTRMFLSNKFREPREGSRVDPDRNARSRF